jgi:hypothetical protein
MPAVAEILRRAYLALLLWAGVGSIPANSDAQKLPSFRRWRFEMKLSPFIGECGEPNIVFWIVVVYSID